MIFLTLIKKELKHYFNSPIAYIILTAFFLLTGWFFSSPVFLRDSANPEYFYSILPLLFIFFGPAVSMRLIADEKKQGTLEHLQTLPVTDPQIVWSKFIASFLFLAIPIVGFCYYHILLSSFAVVDWGVVGTSIFGSLLLMGSVLSIGIFFSSLTQNQIIAFIITAIVTLFCVLANAFLPFIPWPINTLLQVIDFQYHYQSFLLGIISLRDVGFFASIIIGFLVITVEHLRSRHS